MVGQVLGERYELVEALGHGGMAAVWRAVDLRLDRPVAVKILDAVGRADPVALQRLHREARIVARLDHPHIVAVHDVAVGPESAYLVMELVEGGSLADLLSRGPLPVSQAVAFAGQTCEALAVAHAAGVVHRDIKPANLLLTPGGAVKVCDFGIARLAQSGAGATLTRPDVVIGTAAYMAPEQAVGHASDSRTDLYALGCVLYAMLTGAPPFRGDSVIGVLQQHLSRSPQPLQTLRGDVSPELDGLVCDLLAKNPDERPGDAGTVGARLQRVSGVAPAGRPAFAVGVAAPATTTMPRQQPAAEGLSHTRYMPRPASTSWLHRFGRARAAVLAAAAVSVAAVLLITAAVNDPPRDGATPAAGQGGSTSTSSPATTPATTPAQDSRPQAPADPRAAIGATLSDLVDSGELDPGDAKDLRKNLAVITRGRNHDAAEKFDDLRQRVDALHRDGKLADDGYSTLSTQIDDLAAQVPEGDSHDD